MSKTIKIQSTKNGFKVVKTKAIAKISKVSFNTVKKHMSYEYVKSFNEMK